MAGLAAVALTAGGATAWWTAQRLMNPTAPAPNTTTVTPNSTVQNPDTSGTTAQEPTRPVAEQTVQVYFLKDTGTTLELVPANVSVSSDQPTEALKGAFAELLKGTTNGTATSTIPTGTRLLNLDVKDSGVYVDLSSEFTSGGGSTSMTGRLAQVIYTASTLNPNAPVFISVEGRPLETLGGEGLIIDQPMTRAKFDQEFTL
jgi:spore germination protein GerM